MAKVIGYIPPKKESPRPLDKAPESEQKDRLKGEEKLKK